MRVKKKQSLYNFNNTMTVTMNGSKRSRKVLPENSDKKIDKEHVSDE